MENDNRSKSKDTPHLSLSQYVKLDMGQNYCIVSCSKHRLPDLVNVVDSMVNEGWMITSGLTSDDGLMFQSMSKFSGTLDNSSGITKGI